MKSFVDIAVPGNKRHPIWLYYIERTNVVNVFRSFFRSFLTTGKDLSLLPVDDKALSDKLLESVNYIFPVEHSTITRQFGLEQLRWNLYQRIFGYDDKRKAFPRSITYNGDFHNLQESIFQNIARAIWTKESSFQKIADPASLSEMLTNMREILLATQVNDTLNTSLYWTIGFSMLLRLLDDTKLIREKLGIMALGRGQILMAMGAKFGVPVPGNTLYLFDLAERMETILLQIERTHWDINSAEAWYASENFWKLTFNAYYRVWGKDFMSMAVHSFPTTQSIRR